MQNQFSLFVQKNKQLVIIPAIIVGASIVAFVVIFYNQKIHTNQQASVVGAVTDIDVTADITTVGAPAILKSTFGGQATAFLDGFMYDRANPAVFTPTIHTFTPDPHLMQNVYALGFQSFRYPGGTFSRYSHPTTTGSPTKGYGIRASEVISDVTNYQTDWAGIGTCPTPTNCNYITGYQTWLPNSFTNDLVNVANATGPGRTVDIVANLINGTPAETVQQITDFVNAGIAVSGVEMGNEHFSHLTNGGVPTPKPGINMTTTEYLTKARAVAQAIRDVYPNMKIGLVATNVYASSNVLFNPATGGQYLAWDQAMANAIQTETYNGAPLFNAFAAHIYKTANKCLPENATFFPLGLYDPNLELCAKYAFNKITNSNGPTYGTWGNGLGTLMLDETYAYFRNIYGANTESWITEWGLSEGGGAYPNTYSNTILLGAYMQNFHNWVNKYNATHGNTIKFIYYHTLATPELANGAITKKMEPEEIFVDDPNSIYYRRIEWFALKTMSKIYNQPSVTLATTASTMAPQSTDYLNLTSYFDTTNNDIYIQFTNTSGLTAKIPYITIDGLPLSSTSTAATSAEIVSGSSLFSGNGYNNFDHTGTLLPINYQTISPTDISTIVIPGYSFGYLKFSKNVVSGVPVTGFAAVAGNQTAVLSWNPVAGATKYQIWRDGVFLRGINPTTTTYVDSTVTGNTTYSYKVRAKFSINTFSAYSSTILVPVMQFVPAPIISNISVTNILPSSATVSWTTNEPADTQVFFGETTSYGSNSLIDPTMSTTHSVNLSTLGAGTTYHFKVRSSNPSGIVSFSSDQTFTTGIIDIISPVIALTDPLPGAILSGTVTISATASDNVGVTKVDFYRGNTKTATITTPPYSYSWDTIPFVNGDRTIYAKAYDAAGNFTATAPITVKVHNVTP